MAVAADAGFVQRLIHGLANSDAEVFDGMVGVDFQIAFGLDSEVEHAVAGDLIEHVFEEGQTGVRLEAATAVEIQGNGNTGFLCVALNACAARLLAHDCVFPVVPECSPKKLRIITPRLEKHSGENGAPNMPFSYTTCLFVVIGGRDHPMNRSPPRTRRLA